MTHFNFNQAHADAYLSSAINYFASEAYQVPKRAHDAMQAPVEQAFHAALKDRAASTRGLTIVTSGYGLPWAMWDCDPNGGYWIGYGIEFRQEDLPERRRTFLWLSYLRTNSDDEIDLNERPLDVWMTGPSSRDPELLADMVLSVLTRHRKTQS